MTNWAASALELSRMGYYTAAEVAFRRAAPEVETLYNHANVLRRLQRYAEAEVLVQRAIAIHGTNQPLECLLGCLRLDRQDAEGAIELLAPHRTLNGFQMFCYALACLHAGRWKEGFEAYDGRLENHRQPLPLWNGEDLTGKTVAISCEQGYGDTILMARFLEGLPFKHFLLVPNALKGLIPGSISGNSSFSADYMLPLMSLPRRLGATELPSWKPYISPPVRFNLPKAADTRLNVGIVWRSKTGSALRKFDEIEHGKQKSLPLGLLLPLAAIPGVRLYSLQVDCDDVKELGAGYLLENLDNRIADFSDLAGFMADLDLIVTVDSGPAHLAGAMGKPTILMLNYAGSWQWGSGDRTPWYPTVEIVRQHTPGDWKPVAEQVIRRVQELGQ